MNPIKLPYSSIYRQIVGITNMCHYSLNDMVKNKSHSVYFNPCSTLFIDIVRSTLLYSYMLCSDNIILMKRCVLSISLCNLFSNLNTRGNISFADEIFPLHLVIDYQSVDKDTPLCTHSNLLHFPSNMLAERETRTLITLQATCHMQVIWNKSQNATNKNS